MPPEKLTSHRCLLRVWVGVLLTTIMRRKRIPKQRTLFVLDEAAQLGTFDPLVSATTLLRGFGLQLVMVWQDLAQIKSRYPADWATIVNNSAALLSFGFGHYHAAKEYAEVMGLEPGQLASLKPEEAVLAIRGDGTRKISRANYLREPQFDGMFDPNPYFAEEPEMNVEPANPMPPVPATWQEKITHSRTVLMKFLEEAPRKERMVKWSRWSARSCTWRTPSRKSAGRCHQGPTRNGRTGGRRMIAEFEDSHAGHAFLRTIAQQRGGTHRSGLHRLRTVGGPHGSELHSHNPAARRIVDRLGGGSARSELAGPYPRRTAGKSE